jgi:glycosyltransferase involved in cell wall biosynthesis
LTVPASLRRRALVQGTFDPAHTRNRMLLDLLATAGWQTTVARQDVWGSDRVSTVRGDRLGLVRRAVAGYARLVVYAMTAPRPDAVVVLYPGHVDMLVLAPIWRLRRVPVVFDPLLSLYDTAVADRRLVRSGSLRARVLAAIDRLAFALADVVVVDTPEVGAFYADRLGLRADKQVVIWPGTDAERLGATSTGGGEPRRVLFHGNYIPLHGIATIVRAAALLRDAGVAVDFRLVGSGQDRPAIEALIAKLGDLPHLTLVDPMPLERIGDEIRAASICLGIFGTSEKARRVVPFKVFEYLALGRPVITGDSPAARAALGDDVVRVPPGDPSELAAAVRALLDDVDRRDRLGRAGAARFAARFSVEAQAANLRAALDRLTRQVPVAA